jgi:hypothetical protein
VTPPPGEALVDPIGTVVAVVTALDPALDPDTARRVVEQVGGWRAKPPAWRRRWPRMRRC